MPCPTALNFSRSVTRSAQAENTLLAVESIGASEAWGTTATTFPLSGGWTSSVIGPSEGVVDQRVMHVSRVSFGNRMVAFDRGLVLELNVVRDRDMTVISDAKFGFYGSGRTVEEALADYSNFFVDFFADIVDTPSSQLPPSTRAFRRLLLTFGRLVRGG